MKNNPSKSKEDEVEVEIDCEIKVCVGGDSLTMSLEQAKELCEVFACKLYDINL